MCGRIFVIPDLDDLLVALQLDRREGPPLGAPRYNVAPTELVPGVRRDGAALVIGAYAWGLVPAWHRGDKRPGNSFNARVEGVATAPTFRPALPRHRLVVVVSGFYEWSGAGRSRRAHAIRRADGLPMGLAGLSGPPDERFSAGFPTATVLTRPSAGALAPVHDRMPLLLDRAAWAAWLDADVRPADALAAADAPLPELRIDPVGDGVGDARDKSGAWFTAPPRQASLFGT